MYFIMFGLNCEYDTYLHWLEGLTIDGAASTGTGTGTGIYRTT
jgi:hypothetical protein